MTIRFSKYQGSGNDFIMIDNRNLKFNDHTIDISRLCKRNFGIGADGLILIDQDEENDFRMVYYNSDGQEADMCGNGARCAVAFVNDIDKNKERYTFNSRRSIHNGEIITKMNDLCSQVKVSLIKPIIIQDKDDYMVINTGVPHYIKFKEDIDTADFAEEARAIRFDKRFQPEGVNVNYAKVKHNCIFIRTYERGVENETLSCGTGITATAVAAYLKGLIKTPIEIKATGGDLKVHFIDSNGVISNIFLEGPACKVFDGTTEI